MAIADTITSMQNHTSNAYTMIGYGTDLTGINKNLENLSTSIFKAFLESLNNPDTLFTNLPKITGTGSNITLNDTANAPMKIKLNASEMSQSGTPTPESPQDIHTISESNTIEVAGKNVVNALDISSMINFTKDNNVFTSSALTSTGYGGIASTKFTNDVYIPNNSTIYISADIRLVSGTTGTLNVIGDRSLLRLNASWVEKPTLSNQFQRYCYKYDVNAGDSFTGFFVQLYNCSNAVLEVKNVMFSYSNETEYEPYVSQEADIDLGDIEYCKTGNYEDEFIRTSGKNLFDKDNVNVLNGYINASGVIINNTTDRTIWIKIEKNTDYTFQMIQKALSTSTAQDDMRIALFSSQPAFNSTGSIVYSATRPSTTSDYYFEYSFNSSDNEYVAIKIINTQKSNYDNTISTIMLNEGSTALPYEPYGSNEWYIKKNIGKVVLDGSENWAYGGVTSIFYTTSITDYAISNNIPYSNYYKGVNNVTGAANMETQNNNTIGFNNQSGQTIPRFYIKDISYINQDPNDLKIWLSTHNTEVYYILATPTYTQITGTLAEQLENIYQKLKSFKGTTNISQVNNDLPFVLNVQALEDLE